MQIQFSDPMDAGSYSFSKGKKGSNYPLADVAGFTNNNTTLTLKVKLQPNQLYEFIITKRSFQSAEGYPLKQDYPVQFRTR